MRPSAVTWPPRRRFPRCWLVLPRPKHGENRWFTRRGHVFSGGEEHVQHWEEGLDDFWRSCVCGCLTRGNIVITYNLRFDILTLPPTDIDQTWNWTTSLIPLVLKNSRSSMSSGISSAVLWSFHVFPCLIGPPRPQHTTAALPTGQGARGAQEGAPGAPAAFGEDGRELRGGRRVNGRRQTCQMD